MSRRSSASSSTISRCARCTSCCAPARWRSFPGGFGTFDELFELLTLIQTGKVKPIPILFFGREFWERVINFEALVEEGVISADDLKLFTYCETAEEAWDYVCRHYSGTDSDPNGRG